MVSFAPSQTQLVRPEFVDRVPSPAYDSLSPAARRAWRRQHPDSYLNVTRSPEDEEPGSEATGQDLVDAGRKALNHLLSIDAFDHPATEINSHEWIYLYELELNGHRQTGIVGEVLVSDYDDGTIRIHEEIRDARAELLATHFGELGAASSPVALAYRQTPEMLKLIADAKSVTPELRFSDGSGLVQTVWRITDPGTIAAVVEIFSTQRSYIIDGHHRAAATSALAHRRPNPELATMFVAMFPDTELQLLGFNRLVRNLEADMLASLPDRLGLEACDGPPEVAHGTVGVYVRGHWYRMQLADQGAGLDSFDAVRVRKQILTDVLGIERSDSPQLVNLAGDQPLSGLMEMADEQAGVAIVLAPIRLDAFMAAADEGIILPPKSTYFTPKVRSGVFLSLYS